MKIFHIIDKLIGGGAETQLRLLVNNSTEDHSVIYHKRGGEELVNETVDLHFINSSDKIGIIKELLRILDGQQIDLIQLWLPEYICLPAAIYGRVNKIKVISCDRRAPSNTIGYLYFRDRLKVFQHLISSVVVPNFPIVKFGVISKFFLRFKDCHLIYNAVTSQRNTVNKFNSNEDDLTIVFIGRLVKQKRPEILLKLIPLLLDSVDKNKLKIIYFGVGELEKSLNDKAKNLGVEDFVHFQGFNNDWDLYLEKLNGNKLLVFPSINEGMPNVLFESAVAKLPFLAMDIPEILIHFEEVRQNSLIHYKQSENEQITEMYNKIVALYKDTDLTKESTNKNYSIAMGYSLESFLDNWHSLYNRVLNKI